MLIQLRTLNWKDIRSNGSEEWIKEKLGDYVKDFNDDGASFEVSLDEKTAEKAEQIGNAFSKLRVYALGGPLYRYCKQLQNKKPGKDIFHFKLRRDTYMWICPKEDRLTCVFAFEFPIKSDYIIANQILTEFTEVRRQRDFQNTPVISYSKEPPLELKSIKEPSYDKEAFLGYFSVLLLPTFVVGPKLENAVENVIGFRSYLTYHIKCAKAYFHQSMRARVRIMLQILNRARYEPDDERKKKKIIVGAK
jgi:actin related protein 2/3 complex subunit 2